MRNPTVVSAAFGALGAIAASAQANAPPGADSYMSSHYAPMRSIRGGEAPETAQWDYGWIYDWELEGRPRVGKPPLSKWNPDARAASVGRIAGQGPWHKSGALGGVASFRHNEPRSWIKPNLIPPDESTAAVRAEQRRRSSGD